MRFVASIGRRAPLSSSAMIQVGAHHREEGAIVLISNIDTGGGLQVLYTDTNKEEFYEQGISLSAAY